MVTRGLPPAPSHAEAAVMGPRLEALSRGGGICAPLRSTPLAAAEDAAQHPAQAFLANGGAHGAHRRLGHGLGQAVAFAAARARAAQQHVAEPAHQAAAAVFRVGGCTFAIGRGLCTGFGGAALWVFFGWLPVFPL